MKVPASSGKNSPYWIDGGNASLFFLFWLDLPEFVSDSESEKSYGSPQSIGVLVSCKSRTMSSFWRLTSLASSYPTFEIACANFSSAFQQLSLSEEAFSSANLRSSVRLLWWSLYHSTFLSDSEEALDNYLELPYLCSKIMVPM